MAAATPATISATISASVFAERSPAVAADTANPMATATMAGRVQPQGQGPPPKRSGLPAWAIALIAVFGVLVLLGIIGAAIGGQDEATVSDAVDPADRGVCLTAVQLAKASRAGVLPDVAARVEGLRAARAADPDLEATRANVIAIVDSAQAAGVLSADAARQASAAGERLGERCVELKAVEESDLEE